MTVPCFWGCGNEVEEAATPFALCPSCAAEYAERARDMPAECQRNYPFRKHSDPASNPQRIYRRRRGAKEDVA